MFSTRCNCRIKSWRNQKRSTKNNKNQKIKIFINKYNCEGINYPSEKYDWKKIENNNETIASNVLCAKKEKIYTGYVLKNNSNCEKHVILLIVPNGKNGIMLQSNNYQHY